MQRCGEGAEERFAAASIFFLSVPSERPRAAQAEGAVGAPHRGAHRPPARPDTVLPPKQPARPVLSTELFYDNILKTPEDERVATALRAAKAIEKTEEAEPGARGGPTILIHFLTQSNRPPQ